jgi:adenine deaminase
MIVIGTNDNDMYKAAVALIKSQGGKVVVEDGEILAHLPLPVAGLISDKDAEYVIEKGEELNQATRKIGCQLDDAFMAMGFLSLPVIPELKITDKGVFDTQQGNFIDIFDNTPIPLR